MLRALPLNCRIVSFGFTCVPSGTRIVTLIALSTAFGTAAATVAPATTHGTRE